jgi:hypothetical protein
VLLPDRVRLLTSLPALLPAQQDVTDILARAKAAEGAEAKTTTEDGEEINVDLGNLIVYAAQGIDASELKANKEDYMRDLHTDVVQVLVDKL